MNPATDSNRPAPHQRVACDHCGLPVPKGLIDTSEQLQFCCNGCRTVYEMIHANGLERFYRMRDAAEGKPANALPQQQDYQGFDDPGFLDRQTRTTSGGLRAIELRLEGVHCAACLWLVERLPSILPGVVDARLNLRSALVRVTWNPATVKLSEVATTLQRLGYPSHPAGEVTATDVRRKQERTQLIRLGVAGALAGNAMLVAVALYGGVFTGIEPHFELLFRWLSSLLGICSLAWPGAVFFRGAWASIVARRPSLDLPIALALVAGGTAGLFNTVLGRGEVYFDSLSVLVFLLLVGRWFQARQQRWADEAVNLMNSFTPSTCRVVQQGEVVSRPVDSLLPGEIVEVRSGDLLPVDGKIVDGESTVNQALLTGESDAVAVSTQDTVYAGTQNLGGRLHVRVECVGEATRVGGLLRLVDQGVRDKPPIVQFTDRAAGWFLSAVVVLAACTFAGWAVATGIATATDNTIALLIVACPCALGLATPLTMALSIGLAARRNILIKDSGALEKLARTGRVLLDKTGTLTAGRPVVEQWEGAEQLKAWVAPVQRDSQHPIAQALRDAYDSEAAPQAEVSLVQENHDGGIQARAHGEVIHIGCPAYMLRNGVTTPPPWPTRIAHYESTGATVVPIAWGGRVEAIVALRDTLREDSPRAISDLKSLGWSPSIVSGDAQAVVQRVSQQLDLPPEHALGGVPPEEKLSMASRAHGPRETLVMVGDGVNDAAALAAADVGVAVHGGAEAALAAADIYLAEPGLTPLVELIRHSRRTMRVVRGNLVVSITYNLLAVSLAAAGLITPLLAAVLMPLSSATVLGVAVLGFHRES